MALLVSSMSAYCMKLRNNIREDIKTLRAKTYFSHPSLVIIYLLPGP
jgi:hypothetical protein